MTIGDWLWKLTRLVVWLGMVVFMMFVDDKHWYHWFGIIMCCIGLIDVLEEKR